MQIRSTVHPGHRGAKQLLAQYGDRLVCVRYRYDAKQRKRFKTVELIIAEETWAPRRVRPADDTLVPIRLTRPEITLRQQVKQRGGRWDPQRGIWELRYDQMIALGLEERILDSSGL